MAAFRHNQKARFSGLLLTVLLIGANVSAQGLCDEVFQDPTSSSRPGPTSTGDIAPTNAFGDAIDRFLGFTLGRLMPSLTSNRLEVTADEMNGPATLAGKLVEMARQNVLLNQMDPRLNEHGLLVPNGGLCASTCLVNTIGALAVPEGSEQTFKQLTPQLIKLIVQGYKEKYSQLVALQNRPESQRTRLTQEEIQRLTLLLQLISQPRDQSDARYGASVELLTKALESIIGQFGGRISHVDKPTVAQMAEFSKTDSLMLITAELTDAATGNRSQFHGYHALIVLKVFPETSEIVISDPNRPNEIFRTKYAVSENGRIAFKTRVRYAPGGTVGFIEKVDVVTRDLSPSPQL